MLYSRCRWMLCAVGLTVVLANQMAVAQTEAQNQGAYEKYAERLMKSYDKDASGDLDEGELNAMKRPPQNADSDGDSKVSFEELLARVNPAQGAGRSNGKQAAGEDMQKWKKSSEELEAMILEKINERKRSLKREASKKMKAEDNAAESKDDFQLTLFLLDFSDGCQAFEDLVSDVENPDQHELALQKMAALDEVMDVVELQGQLVDDAELNLYQVIRDGELQVKLRPARNSSDRVYFCDITRTVKDLVSKPAVKKTAKSKSSGKAASSGLTGLIGGGKVSGAVVSGAIGGSKRSAKKPVVKMNLQYAFKPGENGISTMKLQSDQLCWFLVGKFAQQDK